MSNTVQHIKVYKIKTLTHLQCGDAKKQTLIFCSFKKMQERDWWKFDFK